MKCPKCGKEMEIRREISGEDENQEPAVKEYAVCRSCRKKWDLSKKKQKPPAKSIPTEKETETEMLKKALDEERPVYSNIPSEEIQKAKEQAMKQGYDEMLAAGRQEQISSKTKIFSKKVLLASAAAILILAAICAGYIKRDAVKAKLGIGAAPEETVKDDGVVNFEAKTFTLKYLSHEMGTDYEGKPCLFVHYSFKNTGKENLVPMAAVALKAVQNGSDCIAAVIMDANAEIDQYMQEVEPGKEVQVCQAYSVEGTEDVTIEASELVSIDGENDTQVIKLK